MTTLHLQSKSNASVYENYSAQFRNNEIDLLSLLNQLWQGKKIIISIILIFALAGGFISFLLPQKWTSHAEITPAEKFQWSELQKTIAALQALGVKTSLDKSEVFNLFLKKFNSQSLRETFLATSPLVVEKLLAADLDAQELQRDIVLLAEKMRAVNRSAVKNSGAVPYQSWTLSFTAPAAEDAQEVLHSYIDYISAQVVKETLDYLHNEVELKKSLEKEALAMERERMNTLHDTTMKRLNYSLEVANAAGIKRPVYSNGKSVQDDPDYSITLGADGIAEKLKIEKSITDVTQLNADFRYREYRLAELEKMDIKDIKFSPFKYQLSPSLPASKDSPKRLIILVLSVMIGGIISCALVLLRHALLQKPQ